MICLYCEKEFIPNYNPNTKKDTIYCSRSCLAKNNLKKFKLARVKLPQLRDKNWLFEQYWIQKRSMRDISRELGCAESRVYVFMDRFGISRRTISESNLGKKKSIEHRMNLSDAAKNRWRGENNPNWRGGINRRTLKARFTYDYEIWRRQLKRKFNNHCAKCNKELGKTCECCGQKILMYVHHIKSVEDYPELVVDINNGFLLCYTCHREIHKLAPDKLGETVKP